MQEITLGAIWTGFRQGIGRLPGRIHGFRKNEQGTLVIFALMLTMLMLMMGGIAVDLMRYESLRTRLQNTLDRSTLAAASLTQELPPVDVVNDYLTKASLQEYLTSITVTEGLNFRNVQASAEADSEPIFLPMMDIHEFEAPGTSAAEQRVNNVEIMLVLDVSGSMASNNRLVNLKVAAKDFVRTVLNSDSEHRISIGLVPFNGQVNLGATLLSRFNTSNPHGAADVNCVDLPTTAYGNKTISQYAFATSPAPEALSMTADADTYSGSGSMAPVNTNKWCPPQPGNIVRLPTQDVAQLQGYIDGLTAIGATSINAGLKWGLGLLDPSSRPIYDNLISAGQISADLAGRPFDYEDTEAMKVIVLMTDGEHFAEDRVTEAYKSGLSPIFRANADLKQSIFHAQQVVRTNATTICNSRPYYVPHLAAWHSRPWTGASPASGDCYVDGAVPVGTTQLTWPQVWSGMRLAYVAYHYYASPLSFGNSTTRTSIYNSMMAAMRVQTPTVTMDGQLQSICNMAKAQDVTIYGIAFEAPTNGQTQIRACSTDGGNGSHYFNAAGLQISTAFKAIASNISQLRLTQ